MKPAAPAGKSADWWQKEVVDAFKSWDKYRERANKVIRRYRDEREEAAAQSKKFNILYANTETLRPAVYSKTPVPDIRRRFNDKDPIGRVAADVLQRSVSFSIDAYDCDAVLSAVNDDYTLPGFGVARIKYIPRMAGDGDQEKLVYQEVQSEYCAWDKFAMSKVATWNRVWWVAFAEDLSKEEVTEKFGKGIADLVEYDRGENGQTVTEATADDCKFCRVWEVWNKRRRERFYVAEGNNVFLRKPEPDPFGLEGFFPCPEPIWAVRTNNTLVPIPEYIQYQDQALELDDLTNRIDVLTSALRRRGVYNAENQDVLQDLVNASDNTFKPVNNWADLMAKGGLERIIAELPIEGIAKIVLSLYQARDQVKQTIYEITGLADIIRGASNAAETATAQQIKGQYAGMRLGRRKGTLAKFARDLIRLKAELIAEKFRPEEFAEMTGLKLFMTVQEKQAAQQAMANPQLQGQIPPEVAEMVKQPTWEEVIRILRSDKLRSFRIDIETDSTIQPDADIAKQRAVETVTAITGYFQQVAPAVQSGAMSIDAAKDLLMVALRTFPNSEKFESVLDQMGEQAGESPQMKQAQAAMQQQQQELAQRESQVKEQETAAALAAKDTENVKLKAQSDLEKRAADVKRGEDMLALKQEMDAKVKAMEAEIERIREQAEKDVEQAVMQARQLTEKHVGAARGELETLQKKGVVIPKKPRRLKVIDNPDGSMEIQELLDEMGTLGGRASVREGAGGEMEMSELSQGGEA